MKTITTDKLPPAVGPYSVAKVVDGIMYASGQCPFDPATGAVVGDDIATQAEQAFENIKTLLEEAGSDLTKVIKTTCFLTDMANFGAFNEVYAKYFTEKPARSCFAVVGLPKGVLCEIEFIAEV